MMVKIALNFKFVSAKGVKEGVERVESLVSLALGGKDYGFGKLTAIFGVKLKKSEREAENSLLRNSSQGADLLCHLIAHRGDLL